MARLGFSFVTRRGRAMPLHLLPSRARLTAMTQRLLAIRRELKAAALPGQKAGVERFFKTGPGQYGHGDKFLGVKVPQTRAIAARYRDLSATEIAHLVRSPIHEERLLALILWVYQFERGRPSTRKQIYRAYLKAINAGAINNWDLVDTSAPQIVGGWLMEQDVRNFSVLLPWTRSPNLWRRRVAMLATYAWIYDGHTEPAFALARALLNDTHDLMHKASGWMLREAGKRNLAGLRAFLTQHAHQMPRTMLRYAIEKMSPAERKKWMAQKQPIHPD